MTEPTATATASRRCTSDPLHAGDGQNGICWFNLMVVEAQRRQKRPTRGDAAVPEATVIVEKEEPKLAQVGYVDILKQFSLLGWVAFGGPAAQIALFPQASCGEASVDGTAPVLGDLRALSVLAGTWFDAVVICIECLEEGIARAPKM